MNKEWIFLAYWPHVETPNVVRAIGATPGDAEATLRAELPGMDLFVNIGYVQPDSAPPRPLTLAEAQALADEHTARAEAEWDASHPVNRGAW